MIDAQLYYKLGWVDMTNEMLYDIAAENNSNRSGNEAIILSHTQFHIISSNNYPSSYAICY